MGDVWEMSVDDLAQAIRVVDGNHSLGAGALAEALMPFIRTASAQALQSEKARADAAEAKAAKISLAFEYAVELMAGYKVMNDAFARNSQRYAWLRNKSRLIATNDGLQLANFSKEDSHKKDLDDGIDLAIEQEKDA